MSLNNIELPAAVLADLYGSFLVGEMSSKEAIKAPSPASLPAREKELPDESSSKHLGNNQQHILLVVKHSDCVHLPDSELQFLTSILTACKLGLEDVAIINFNNFPGSTYKELNKLFKSKTVLLFGTEPSTVDLPLSFPHFQPQPFNGCTYLFSPALKELENDKMLKSKLWLCMKKIFSL